ncbi:MAG: hypothetical protein DRJ42_14470 [Deltaproteobacteria bacterium]|nr:MAG: hypothetical protein DRJ42_14470 [Deltaproteobacteria bacterium]
MTTFRLMTIFLLAFALGACEDEAPSETAPPESTEGAGNVEAADPGAGAEAQPEAPSGDDSEAGPLVDDPTFELRATASDTYANGELAQFDIRITPKGEYHMNEEFPTTITVHSVDGVAFPNSELEAGDAAEFGAALARFDVPFTASAAGEHRVVCDVSFAVCTASNCIPENRTLAVVLPVE